MVEWAKKYIGIPYRLHSFGMDGCDCYGLVVLIFKQEFGIDLPRYDSSYSSNSSHDDITKIYNAEVDKWHRVDKPSIGSVVYLMLAGHPKHVGVMVSDTHFVHNLKSPQSSMIGSINNHKWKNRIIGFYNYE